MLLVLIFALLQVLEIFPDLDFGCVSGSEPQPFQVKAGEVPFPILSVISDGFPHFREILCRSWHWLRISLKIVTCHLTACCVHMNVEHRTGSVQPRLHFTLKRGFSAPRVTQVVSNCLQRSQRSSHLKDLSWEVQWHRAQRSDQKGTAKWILVASCCNDSQIIQDARCDRWYALICVDHDSCM